MTTAMTGSGAAAGAARGGPSGLPWGRCREVTGTLLELIGRTPLIDLSALVDRPGAALYAKAEHFNPAGSVKDRPARAMVEAAVRQGLLTPGRSTPRILDATSGNTGIAYAMIGAALGIPVTLCLPANASVERRRTLTAYGVELHLTDPAEGSDGAIREARRLAAEAPQRFVYLDQYANPENWRAHYRTTGPEIWEQSGGRITHFVTGLGTSGTFMGVGRYLSERDVGITLVALQPDSPFHGLEGMKHMDTALVPPIYERQLAHQHRDVRTEDAYDMVKRLARETGWLVGISAGANVAASVAVAREQAPAVVVTMLCDDASKYLSERFWEEEEP